MAQRNNKYTKIDNDYSREQEQVTKRKKINKKLAVRRIVFFFCLPILTIVWFITTIFDQSSMIESKQVMLEEAKENLAQAKQQQELLKMQITQYEDDEYIAKILRKEYLLSEDGEIIFVMPEDALEDESDSKK